jgi:hypothetical protein
LVVNMPSERYVLHCGCTDALPESQHHPGKGVESQNAVFLTNQSWFNRPALWR